MYRIDPRGDGHEQIADTGGFALGICLDRAGSIYVCDPDRHAVIRVVASDGHVEPWCDSADGRPLMTPNWAAFAPDGSMWLSDSGTESLDVRDGRLLRVPPGGGGRHRAAALPQRTVPGPDGRVHWLESFTPCLRRLTDGGPELVAALPGVVPDGVALDGEGGFLIGCYYPFRLLRVGPGGG